MSLLKKLKKSKFNYRHESFGGIISSEEPPFLAHVDQNFIKDLGLPESSLWSEKSELLSAPLEVHFSVTNKCSAGCKTCYTNSLPNDPNELSIEKFKEAIDILSDMKVFHLAMGGGEALEREDFFELVEYVRSKNITPNLTTNGFYLNKENVKKCKMFGQVNISIDGLSSTYEAVRGHDNFINALNAVRLLKENSVRVGINCVVTKQNFEELHNLAKLAKKEEVYDIELLRIKPTGRADKYYENLKLTNEQNINFFPMLNKIAKKTGVRLKADCSFIPMIAFHKPNKKLMEKFSVYGCEAGSVLLGVTSSGHFAGCSFLKNEDTIFNIKDLWHNSNHLKQCREIKNKLSSPCVECQYLSICKGGCQAISKYYSAQEIIPDPECPIIQLTKEI